MLCNKPYTDLVQVQRSLVSEISYAHAQNPSEGQWGSAEQVCSVKLGSGSDTRAQPTIGYFLVSEDLEWAVCEAYIHWIWKEPEGIKWGN